MAARLHRAAARRLPEPRPSGRPSAGASTSTIGPDEYAQLALAWREEGAQIIGGCCGTTPGAHRRGREGGRRHEARPQRPPLADGAVRRRVAGGRDARSRGSTTSGRVVFPLPFPKLDRRPGRLRPDARQLPRAGSTCSARASAPGMTLPRRRLRLRHPRRPAGAQRRRARARDRHRPQRRRQHARQRLPQRRRRPRDRRGRRPLPVGARASATTSSSRASTRCPSTRSRSRRGHRPLDYWGRNLLDHFLRIAAGRCSRTDGTAYVMQLSIVGAASRRRAPARAARLREPRRRLQLLPVRAAVRREQGADRAGRGAVRRLPPDARRPGRDGRLPARDRARHVWRRVGPGTMRTAPSVGVVF